MGPGLPNLPSIQNPRSSQDRFEHACAAQLHMTQAREPERYIFALQPFPAENGFLCFHLQCTFSSRHSIGKRSGSQLSGTLTFSCVSSHRHRTSNSISLVDTQWLVSAWSPNHEICRTITMTAFSPPHPCPRTSGT